MPNAILNKPPVETRELPKVGDHAERSFRVERTKIDEGKRTVELAFSSEEPYLRWFGYEILDHAKGACDLTRLKSGGALLCDHDWTDQVGVIESVRIDDDRVGRAVVRFGKSARAEEIFRDVVDGIRSNVSVGYMIDELVLQEHATGEDDTYLVTKWCPYEISLVSVPADITVGVGRASSPNKPAVNVPVKESTVPDPVIDTPDVKKIEADAKAAAREAEKVRAKTIIAIGDQFKQYGVDKLVADALNSDMSIEEFRAKAMEKISTTPLPAPTSEVGLTGADVKRYSVLRAIRAMVDKDWTGAEFEREIHQAILKRAKIAEAPNNGFFVPHEVQKRDMTAGSPSGGGYLVATDNLAASFIDLLRNRALVAKLGATMLTGLVGNVTIPKMTGAGTAYWLTNEATAITESNQTLGQLALSPKNVGAYTEVSRQLMLQSSPAADALIMNDLAKVLALAIDVAALRGAGSGGEPTGIVNTSGIGSVTGTSIDWAKVLEFQTDVAGSNALVDTCAYLTTPAVAALLAQRQRFSNTDTPLWDGGVLDGKMGGFRAASTLQMTAASMLFGDWSQVVIGEWGMLEIALNPYANFTAAISGIRAIQTVDIGIRIPGAFSLATSIT